VDDEAAAIIAAIRAAFRGVARGAITLHEAEVIDDYGTDEERAAARELDTERGWEEIPDAYVEECPSALYHVDPESWRYYVPRYMEWSIRHFRSSDSFLVDSTIYGFNPSTDATLLEHEMERYRTLTAEQAQAVCRFLRYMARHADHADADAADDALRKYWAALGEPSAA
jgi:hypothetical protein